MADRDRFESLLVDHLPWIDRVVSTLARRNGLRGDDADDFSSWVRIRLIEEDYAILRKFRGESTLSSYLAVVLSMLMREYRVSRWGRWRPSAAAVRAGELAVRLETLVYRDGHGLEQAAEILRSQEETELTTRELAELLSDLPRRGPMRPVEAGSKVLEGLPTGSTPEDGVADKEWERDHRRVAAAIRNAISELDTEDGLMVKMQYWEGMTIAEVARALQVPQKPLYRRAERVRKRLREALEARGVSVAAVQELLAGGTNRTRVHLT